MDKVLQVLQEFGLTFVPLFVAIDAVGVALLKLLGSNESIMKPKIFEQEQILRARELGLGATSPSEIEIIPADAQSREYRERVVEILEKG